MADIMLALDHAATTLDWETQFHLVRTGNPSGWEMLRAVAKSCAGAVVVGHVEPGDGTSLRRLPVPVVHVGAGEPEEHPAVVRVDNRYAGAQVAEHLLALGHRRTAIVGPRRWTIPFAERREGLLTTFAAAGVSPPLVLSQPDPDAGTIVRLWVAGATAAVCVYDRLALYLLRAAREAGVRVPDDLSVAGFDDMDWSGFLAPALTTVHIPRHQMAAMAIDRLQAFIRGEPLEAPLIIRPNPLSEEDNRFGTDEFLAWCAATGAEPYLNNNCRSVEEAVRWLEYTNHAGDTHYTRLRAANGHPEPYGVRYWGLGNEVYGAWQMGHRTAEQYAAAARELPATDPSSARPLRVNRWSPRTAADALFYAGVFHALQRLSGHSVPVSMANTVNLINANAPIVARPAGVVKSATYYVWDLYQNHTGPIALPVTVEGPSVLRPVR